MSRLRFRIHIEADYYTDPEEEHPAGFNVPGVDWENATPEQKREALLADDTRFLAVDCGVKEALAQQALIPDSEKLWIEDVTDEATRLSVAREKEDT